MSPPARRRFAALVLAAWGMGTVACDAADEPQASRAQSTGTSATDASVSADAARGSSRDSSAPSLGADADATLDGASACVASPAVCPDASLTYADVAPIFESRCGSCHTGQGGAPWPFHNYDQVASWEDLIQADLIACTMPPADAGSPMTRDERTTILTWITCGYPQFAPPPASDADGASNADASHD